MTYVPQGSKMMLQIGDAIEFCTKSNTLYCVVGLVRWNDSLQIIKIDENNKCSDNRLTLGMHKACSVPTSMPRWTQWYKHNNQKMVMVEQGSVPRELVITCIYSRLQILLIQCTIVYISSTDL